MSAHHIRALFALSIICSLGSFLYASTGKSHFTIRSQGLNMPRNMVGMEPYDCCTRTTGFPCFYVGVTPAFSQSLSNDNLEEYLFFNGTNTMNFGGLNSRSTDVFARNFLLNDNFEGSVTIKPDIQSSILNLQCRINLNTVTEGLYFETYIPITWSQWDLHLEEKRITAGTEVAANKLGNLAPADSFLRTVARAWIGDTINVNTFPAVQLPMAYGTVEGKQTEVALADLYITFGYPVIMKPDWQLDVQLHYIAPVGKRTDPHFFFGAQVGNGKHNGLGAGIHGYHYITSGPDSALSAVFDLRAYHLFGSSQRRTFDLEDNGIGSRYLLFKRFNSDGIATGEVLFGPNVTTLNCKVTIGALVEATLMATYDWCSWQFNAGANAYLQSKEGIRLKELIPVNTFGIQGNTNSNSQVDLPNAQTASQTRVNGENANRFDQTPTFITTTDLNLNSAATPTAVSYMLFGQASRFWRNNEWEPFVAIGGELELSAFSNKALSQCSLWLKCGFSYI